MTKSEAIEILRAHHMWTGEPQEIIDVRKENEALDMAIQALSQELTFDDECQKDMDEAWEQIQKKRKRIPVTQKSGKWNEYYTSQKGNNVFNCKECGHTFVVMQGKDNMNFCPNCGAKMESEDKE